MAKSLEVEVTLCCATCTHRQGYGETMKCHALGRPFPVEPYYKCYWFRDGRGQHRVMLDLDKLREI